MLNVLDKTLCYYQEIFRFIVQSDEYQKFIYIKKKLLTPYRPGSSTAIDNQDEDSAPKEDAMTLVTLVDQITTRVRDKFDFELEGIDKWDPDMDPLDIFFLLRGPQAAFIIPVTDPLRLLHDTGSDPEHFDLGRQRFFIIAINPISPKKELLQSMSLSLRRAIKPLKKRRRAKAAPPCTKLYIGAGREQDLQPFINAAPSRSQHATPVIPVTNPLKAFNCSADDLLRLNMERHRYFIIGIEPDSPKKELLQSIDLALRTYLTPQRIRRPKAVKIPRGEAFKLARLGSTFEEIGFKFGTTLSAAHKAFKRDFNDVYGKEYQPGFTNRKAVPIYQLSKTCDTCADKKGCKKLCPEMQAYVDQDYGSMKEQQKDYDNLANISAKNDLRPVFR